MPKTKHKPGIHLESHPTIDQINRAIAIFMGLIPVPAGTIRLGDIKYPEVSEPFLQYHSSWDWLMPVVEKIESLDNGRFGFTVDPWQVMIEDYITENTITITCVERERSAKNDFINTYYQAITTFLEWYIKQKK